MTDTASSFDVFRCPSCARPGKVVWERCRHCGTNYKTGEADGFAARTFDGGRVGLLALGGSFAIGLTVLCVIAFFFINRPEASSPPADAAQEAVVDGEVASSGSTAPLRSYSAAQLSMICRAGIAAEFGRSHKIMNAKAMPNVLTRISYRRPDDQRLWKSDCKVEGDRIVWRTVDAFVGSGPGRWRTSDYDDVLTFTINGKSVTTKSSDGSSASETYLF